MDNANLTRCTVIACAKNLRHAHTTQKRTRCDENSDNNIPIIELN